MDGWMDGVTSAAAGQRNIPYQTQLFSSTNSIYMVRKVTTVIIINFGVSGARSSSILFWLVLWISSEANVAASLLLFVGHHHHQ